jgi:hypothetical protein
MCASASAVSSPHTETSIASAVSSDCEYRKLVSTRKKPRKKTTIASRRARSSSVFSAISTTSIVTPASLPSSVRFGPQRQAGGQQPAPPPASSGWAARRRPAPAAPRHDRISPAMPHAPGCQVARMRHDGPADDGELEQRVARVARQLRQAFSMRERRVPRQWPQRQQLERGAAVRVALARRQLAHRAGAGRSQACALGLSTQAARRDRRCSGSAAVGRGPVQPQLARAAAGGLAADHLAALGDLLPHHLAQAVAAAPGAHAVELAAAARRRPRSLAGRREPPAAAAPAAPAAARPARARPAATPSRRGTGRTGTRSPPPAPAPRASRARRHDASVRAGLAERRRVAPGHAVAVARAVVEAQRQPWRTRPGW